MPDSTTPTPGQTAGGAQSAQPAKKAGLQIPSEVQKKFGELLELIKVSESMNDEERQYWINILPVMTPDQVQNLREILENERRQLAAIDAKYQTEIDKLGQAEVSKQAEEERRKRRTERTSVESSAQKEETEKADDLLKQIEDAGGKSA